MDNLKEPDQVKHRAFRGNLEFRGNDYGKMTIVNETPLEKYIESIMASELKADFPVEALKALAITIRSNAMAGLNIRHYNDPYDLCVNYHCQIYSGVSRVSKNVTQAVQDTMGMVLMNKNKIFNSDHTLICGGCTEEPCILDSEIMQSLDTNVFDEESDHNEKLFEDLKKEESVKKWIDSQPDVYCNLSRKYDANYLVKDFRWEVTYSRQELEEIISEKQGKMIGTLYDILPRKRKFSGRLIEIEIIASNRNLMIAGEQNIRTCLTRDILNSSCFYVEKELDVDGIPFSFTIRGAGVGHGVGLCQAGSVAMAINGLLAEDILRHYFKGTKIKKVY